MPPFRPAARIFLAVFAATSEKIHVRESPYLYPRTLELRSPCPGHARSYKSCTKQRFCP